MSITFNPEAYEAPRLVNSVEVVHEEGLSVVSNNTLLWFPKETIVGVKAYPEVEKHRLYTTAWYSNDTKLWYLTPSLCNLLLGLKEPRIKVLELDYIKTQKQRSLFSV